MNWIKSLLGLFFKQEEEYDGPPKLTMTQLAWHHGYEARERNEAKESCPYRKGSVLYQHWITGWEFGESVYQDVRKARR